MKKLMIWTLAMALITVLGIAAYAGSATTGVQRNAITIIPATGKPVGSFGSAAGTRNPSEGYVLPAGTSTDVEAALQRISLIQSGAIKVGKVGNSYPVINPPDNGGDNPPVLNVPDLETLKNIYDARQAGMDPQSQTYYMPPASLKTWDEYLKWREDLLSSLD
jgi:hypothetical protein